MEVRATGLAAEEMKTYLGTYVATAEKYHGAPLYKQTARFPASDSDGKYRILYRLTKRPTDGNWYLKPGTWHFSYTLMGNGHMRSSESAPCPGSHLRNWTFSYYRSIKPYLVPRAPGDITVTCT